MLPTEFDSDTHIVIIISQITRKKACDIYFHPFYVYLLIYIFTFCQDKCNA